MEYELNCYAANFLFSECVEIRNVFSPGQILRHGFFHFAFDDDDTQTLEVKFSAMTLNKSILNILSMKSRNWTVEIFAQAIAFCSIYSYPYAIQLMKWSRVGYIRDELITQIEKIAPHCVLRYLKNQLH